MRNMKCIIAGLILMMTVSIVNYESAYCQDEEWAVSLTFKTDEAIDMMPLVIGVGPESYEIPKPPSIVTSSTISEPHIHSSILGPRGVGASAQIYQSGNLISEKRTSRVWALEISTSENNADVSVDITIEKHYFPENLTTRYVTFIVPDQNSSTDMNVYVANFIESNTEQTLELYNTTSSNQSKVLFVMVGYYESFVLIDGQNVRGKAVRMGNQLGLWGKTEGIKVEIDGNTASSELDKDGIVGFFQIDNVGVGNKTITINDGSVCTSPFLSFKRDIYVTGNGYSVIPLRDLLPGNSICDDRLGVADVGPVKDDYGKTSGNGCTRNDLMMADMNGDCYVNIFDLGSLKYGYGRLDTEW